MTLLRAFAIFALLPGFAAAQTSDAPLIQLQPSQPAAGAPVEGTGSAETVPQPSPVEAPKINLSPAVPNSDATRTTEASPVLPIDRDTGAPSAEAAEGWLLALVPAQDAPTEVRIGGSMPVPGQFRLSGEIARADFLLTLPDDVPAPKELLLSLRSSANVLPDTSQLTVIVNGTEVEKITLDNIGEFKGLRLPASTLTPGVNHITLSASQTHRIFCGPEASFAVWTEIDLGQSGVLIDPALLKLDTQGFLAAAHSQIASGGAIEILVEDTTDLTLIRDIASRITDAVGGAPKIAVLPFYSMQTGHDARARVALITSASPKASFRRGAGGALVLQIEHGKDATTPDLSTILPVRPAEWGVAALTPGRVTTLAELGPANILANTHYFRQDLDFLLPEDWLLLASQKAEVTVHYGFSADLPEGALLLIKVNEQTVRLLPLDREGGKVQPPLAISFRANRLNPGINTLTFEMTVPGDPPDLPCTPRSSDMLVILGDSSLDVPPSPKMRQTDMSRSLARLDGSDVTTPAEVANPAQDTNTLLAFGALFRPLISDGTEARLHIVGLNGVGLVPTGDTGTTRRMLQNAVYPALELPVASDATEPTTAPAFSLANADGEVVAPEGEAASAERSSTWEALRRIFSPEGWAFREVGGVRDMSLPGTLSFVSWLEGKSGTAMLLQLDPTTPDDIWLIAGPDISMNDLANKVDSFRRGGRGEAHGQAALLLKDGSWVTWSEKRRPELLEPLTLSNLRSVLGNYASWSPSIFTLITLILALVSVIPALFFVLLTRRSGSRI